MKSFVIFGTLLVGLATLTAGQFSTKQFKCFTFESDRKTTTTYDLTRIRGNSCQVSITSLVEFNDGQAISSQATSSKSCSYVPECFTQGSGGSSGGGNRNNGGNFGGNFGGNQNNGGNSGGNCQVDCKKSSCTVSDGRGTLGSCFLPPFPTKCSGLPSGCGSCVNQCSKK